MNAPALPNRLLPFSFHFYRQFPWGCLGLIVFPIMGRAVFASVAYAIKRLTERSLTLHDAKGPMRWRGHLRCSWV